MEEAAGPPRGGLRVGQRGPRLTPDLLHGLPLLGLSFLPVRRGQPAPRGLPSSRARWPGQAAQIGTAVWGAGAQGGGSSPLSLMPG